MSVRYYYLARAAQVDAYAQRINDQAMRCALQLTAEAWRLLAKLAHEQGFDDLPALQLRLPPDETIRHR